MSKIPFLNAKIQNGEALRGAEIRIPVPWGHIAGKAWGTPDGYPILGLHGWLDNAGSFDKLAPLLPKSALFIVIDMHGHGFSSHLPAGIPFHVLDTMFVIRRVISHLEWKKFSIIGHSFGAGLGALFSALYPKEVSAIKWEDEVENLVMLDLIMPVTGDHGTTNAGTINAFLELEKSAKTPVTYSFFDALERMRKATNDWVAEDEAKILMIRGARQVDEDEYCFTTDVRFRCPTLSRVSHEDTLDLLKNMKCRLLLIKAKDGPSFHSQDVVLKATAIYQSSCSEFQKVNVEGNHFVHLNNPSSISDAIVKFLALS